MTRATSPRHFIGIPLIVVAVAVLLSRPQWARGWLSPAVLVSLASAWFYLRLELRLGVLMTVLLGLCVWAGAGAWRSKAQWSG